MAHATAILRSAACRSVRPPLRGLVTRLLVVAAAVWLMATAQTAAGKESRAPNFVFILVDDLGWADIGCFGSTFYETKQIDQLAAEGVRLTDAYAACPVCSPTRASILSGKYPARLQLTNFLVGQRTRRGSPILPAPYKHQMELSEVTLAEALKSGGYATAHVGKWHLGEEPYFPQHQGFDLNIAGTRAGMPKSFFYPAWQANVPLEGKPGDYLPDRLTDEALKFITDKREQPFFLYLAYYSVHIPIQGKPDLVARYRDKPAGKTQANADYAAMVHAVDDNVGRVTAHLKELGLAENTVVVFFSDNGGLSTPEGPKTPATNNAPLRAGKGHLHEGGIREPCIVRWPGHIKPGGRNSTPITSVDFYPTFLEMAGIEPPAEQTLDGVSLARMLTESAELPDRSLYWHYPHFSNQGGMPGGAVRQGTYKLIEFYEHGNLELYDLASDIGEQRNLAKQLPEVTQRLHRQLVSWRKEVNANMPVPNPNYQPQK